jgi:arylsulfatase A-like enzyme
MRRGFEKVDPKGHATDVFTEWAVAYIAERAPTGKPFFLYLAYNAPHTPIQPAADWLEMAKRREPNISEKRAKLVAMIEHLDHGVGEVVQALKAHGVYDNTLIIFASDNGGQLGVGASNGGLRGGKGQMYEGGIRVPQVAVWPGKIKPGGITDRTMLTMDWFPTICEIAGVRLDHDIDGVSMRSTLLGEAQAPDSRVLFWTRREGGNRFMGGASRAVRDGDWKLLQNAQNAPFELYNLAEDPREEHDLREKARKQFNELARKLRIHIQRGGRVVWQPPG